MRSRARPPGSPWWPRRFAPRDRQAAYAVVQRNAMKVFDQGADFLRQVDEIFS
jgi:hypothetical protein